MKTHIAMKNIPARRIFRAGYCELQAILNRDNAQFYNAGVYGWNCDIYIDWKTDIAITTGYRNMRGASIPQELIDKYNAQAKALTAEMWTRPDWREAKEALARAFWDELATI